MPPLRLVAGQDLGIKSDFSLISMESWEGHFCSAGGYLLIYLVNLD